jgi:uncharacterized repeat protein (TIGR03803 family)
MTLMEVPMCYMRRWTLVLVVLIAAVANAQTFTNLAYFDGGQGDLGLGAYSVFIQGRDGNFYGTSVTGGANGFGTIFKLTPPGTLTDIYAFCAETNCTDGTYPSGALVLGTDGCLYGTAQQGGANGLGTVFKITAEGVFSVLYSFTGVDGSLPYSALVLGSDGNFYGTTQEGGAYSAGTVFKVTKAGALTTLHSFNGSDGSSPSAPLVQGTDGDLYGTTALGGSSTACTPYSCGTVFKVTKAGGFTSLHSFDFADGEEPLAPLVQATSGGFYGTTYEGGDVGATCLGGCGTIFKITAGGTFATVHKFFGSDGGTLQSGLTLASNGGLYGGNPREGCCGDIFELILPRTIAVAYLFNPSYGSGGNSPVLQATNGTFYGTYASPGIAFSLDTGLQPFAAFVIPSGKVGQKAQILGQGLTGTTSVTFNGVAATNFSVVSDTYMTAVVPIGATSGPVVVTTPTGQLTSNVSFNITK